MRHVIYGLFALVLSLHVMACQVERDINKQTEAAGKAAARDCDGGKCKPKATCCGDKCECGCCGKGKDCPCREGCECGCK